MDTELDACIDYCSNLVNVDVARAELIGLRAEQQRAAQLEAERDIYKNGFDALTTVSDKIVKERDEARAERDESAKKLQEFYTYNTSIIMMLYKIDEEVFGPLTTKEGITELKRQRDEANKRYSAHFQAAQQREEKLKRALAQHQATRRELLDTIAALKRENESMAAELQAQRDTIQDLTL